MKKVKVNKEMAYHNICNTADEVIHHNTSKMDYSLCSLNDFCSVVKPVVKVAEDGKLPTKKFIPDFWNIMKH